MSSVYNTSTFSLPCKVNNHHTWVSSPLQYQTLRPCGRVFGSPGPHRLAPRMNPETNHCRSVYGITNKGGKGHVVFTSSSCNHSHPQPMFIIFGASYLMFIPGPQLGLLRSCLGTGTTAGLVVLGSQHVAASSRDQRRGHPGIIPRISANML